MSMYMLPAHASRESEEVAQLLEQGKADQAAKQADGYLKQNPGDVEMRFIRGVVATEQKQNAQAIKIFSALTREYPNMPEPYNNLAVLYAADGQERKAAEALEQAIRTNPSYTTAHENLGDLYARMASEAYSKALQLDGSRQALKPKLALITQIVPGQTGQAKAMVASAGQAAAVAPLPAPAAAPAAPRAKAPEPKPESKPEVKPEPKAEPKVEAKPEPKAEPKPAAKPVEVAVAAAPAAPTPVVVAKAEAKPEPKPKAEPKPEAKAEPKPEPKADPKPKPAAKSEDAPAKAVAAAAPAADAKAASPATTEVEAAVNAWASAWEKQDMTRYLDAYSDKFTPADGSSLAKWRDTRRQRIVGKSEISVSLRNLKVAIDGDKATANFRQHYTAGALKSTARKTLTLHREKGQWRIISETT
ncbi:L,D-transpeptidase Cds6 family protein [Comamonas humi]